MDTTTRKTKTAATTSPEEARLKMLAAVPGIEIMNGRACCAWSGEEPYHGLGFEVESDTTPERMMVAAGVDWGVELHDIKTTVRTGKGKRAKTRTIDVTAETGKRVLLRDVDLKPFDVVGKGWHPIQNEDAWKFFIDFADKGKLEMSAGGSLRGGKMVFALARGLQDFSLFRGRDKIETYVLFANPHEYGKSALVMIVPKRVVSASTLPIAPRGAASKLSARISHRRPFKSEEVQKLLEGFAQQVDVYKAQAEYLATRRLDQADFQEYLREVFPNKTDEKPSRQAEIAEAVLETQPGSQFGKGTWWAAYCAVLFTADHLLGQQYKDEEESAMRDRRVYSAWFGYMARRKVFALERAVEYAKRSRSA